MFTERIPHIVGFWNGIIQPSEEFELKAVSSSDWRLLKNSPLCRFFFDRNTSIWGIIKQTFVFLPHFVAFQTFDILHSGESEIELTIASSSDWRKTNNIPHFVGSIDYLYPTIWGIWARTKNQVFLRLKVYWENSPLCRVLKWYNPTIWGICIESNLFLRLKVIKDFLTLMVFQQQKSFNLRNHHLKCQKTTGDPIQCSFRHELWDIENIQPFLFLPHFAAFLTFDILHSGESDIELTTFSS